MGELINGRTPEEIKRWLRWATYRCDRAEDRCATCEYRDDCGEYCGSDTYKEALAYIEHLESERDAALAKVQKWISVKERLPKGFISVQVYMTDAGDFPSVREGYYVDEDRFYIPALHEFHPVSHWKPFDEPPEEDE